MVHTYSLPTWEVGARSLEFMDIFQYIVRPPSGHKTLTKQQQGKRKKSKIEGRKKEEEGEKAEPKKKLKALVTI